jgi:hypothetical protein
MSNHQQAAVLHEREDKEDKNGDFHHFILWNDYDERSMLYLDNIMALSSSTDQ